MLCTSVTPTTYWWTHPVSWLSPFTAPSPQVVYERLWADCLHLCVGPLPPGGTALGLCLDLVVFLPGRGLLLLLGPPLRSRYQTLTLTYTLHIKAWGFKADKCSLFKLFGIILAFFVDHIWFLHCMLQSVSPLRWSRHKCCCVVYLSVSTSL